MTVRKAFLANEWYTGDPDRLKKELDLYFMNKEFGPGKRHTCLNQEERSIIGGVSGHAGLAYSGPASACTYAKLFHEKVPDTIIILGFHHREPYGNVFIESGEWETPLGSIKIDSEFSNILKNTSKKLKSNSQAFLRTSENSVELQMPMIKYCMGDNEVKILPIKLQSHSFKDLEQIADELSRAIIESKKDIVIVASSDMSHYHIHNSDQLKIMKSIDKKVIEQFLTLNEENVLNQEAFMDKDLYKKLNSSNATVCGAHTMATLISICKKLNASKAECLKYYTSKDISPGGHPWTVGYFSGIIIKD